MSIKNISILIPFLFSCTTTIPPSNEIIKNKSNEISEMNVSELGDEKKYIVEWRKFQHHLDRLNVNYYGKLGLIPFRYFDSKTKESTGNFLPIYRLYASPNDEIIMTNSFSEKAGKILTDGEIIAILCHETAHMFNNDWREKIISDNSKEVFNYSKNVSLSTVSPSQFAIGAAFTKLVDKNKSNRDILIHAANPNNYASNHFSSDKESEDSKIPKSVSFGSLLNAQDFTIETEKKADKRALDCLVESNESPLEMANALSKLINNNPFKLQPNAIFELKERLKYLKELDYE